MTILGWIFVGIVGYAFWRAEDPEGRLEGHKRLDKSRRKL